MMYKFLLKLSSASKAGPISIFEVNELPAGEIADGIYLVSPGKIHRFDNQGTVTILLGDVIPEGNKIRNAINYKTLDMFFKNLKGTFYAIRIGSSAESIEIASSIFGIFPVYYLNYNDNILISSEINGITAVCSSGLTFNKRFILEKILFYYPLFDQTIYTEIRNLPANSALKIIKGKIHIAKYLDISDQFESNPMPYRKHTGVLSDYFIDTSKVFFPSEPFHITFTGGFDGRTLVACAKYQGCNFKTFSLGDISSDDVTIPINDAKKIGINHMPIYLDNTEYVNQFLELGKEMIDITGMSGNLLYTHFLHASKIISRETSYLFTGFGGSEIFRSLDIRGAVTSHELVDFYEFSGTSEWKDRIRNSEKLKMLNTSFFKNEIDSLIEDLASYQNLFDKSMGLSERIYIYLYEEIFRKVYGPVINSMFKNTIVRNPYLDYEFNSELLKYSIAGVYSKFFVKNPAKRYKGQVLYGHIITKTSPVLANLVTGKGYKPKDLTSYAGLMNITLNFFKKRLIRKIKRGTLDNLALISSFDYNKELFTDLISENEYFNSNEISKLLVTRSFVSNIKERDLLLLAFSIGLYQKMHHEKDILTDRL